MFRIFKPKVQEVTPVSKSLLHLAHMLVSCVETREKKDRQGYYKNPANADYIAQWVLEILPTKVKARYGKDPDILHQLAKHLYLAYIYEAHHITREDSTDGPDL